LQHNGLSLTPGMYETIVRCYLDRNYDEMALTLYDEMKVSGFAPSPMTVSRIISHYCKLGVLKKALEEWRFFKQHHPTNRTGFVSVGSHILPLIVAGNIDDNSSDDNKIEHPEIIEIAKDIVWSMVSARLSIALELFDHLFRFFAKNNEREFVKTVLTGMEWAPVSYQEKMGEIARKYIGL